MKGSLFGSSRLTCAPLQATIIRVWLLSALSLGWWAAPARAVDRQYLHNQVPAAATNAALIRHSSRWRRLNLAISLPLRDREGLTNLLQQLYDPASPNFRHFLTPEQFAQRFAPTEEDYQAVVHFARSHGLLVTAQHPNRTLVSVQGTVADIERAFHVTLNEYEHPTESRTFFAPDGLPSLDLTTPILAVSGLDNYVVPHPCLKPSRPGKAKPALGSGPNGAYLGNDFRAAYLPYVTLTGAGQTVGMLEFDSGYFQSDITAYESLAHLPNVPVSAVLLDGYNGGPGIGNDEVSLDIEMVISMAPGLTQVLVYEGAITDDILNRMATDNLAKQIAASWTYQIDAESDQIFLQFAAQGQSYFNASGDGDAYSGSVPPPTDDPNITIVGGTTLSTTGGGGAWVSETVWNEGGGEGSAGGISPTIAIPIWQKGISMTANQGSTTMRNLPDVALTADNIYGLYGDGQSDTFIGTSCAVQLWSGFTALMNELALTNGEPTVGFVNPAVYAIGKGSNSLSYTALFHDITTGNNEGPTSPSQFVAVAGYDLCTGWGTPNGSNLIMAIALPEPLRITPSTSTIFTGPVGGPFTPAAQTFSLTNNGQGSLNWSLANAPSWLTVSSMAGTLVKGGAADTVTASVALTATNLPPGSYSAALRFTNLGDAFGQTRLLTLDVVTPPVITAQPTNAEALEGSVANFSVETASNALMFYQWQEDGVNLKDKGNISGSATSTLTISNVVPADERTFSVILSNAAGVLSSSNATLTIMPSQPVIVLQPSNQSVLPGQFASFSVAAIGNTPYSYKWQFNGKILGNNSIFSGVTSDTLTISDVSSTNAGTYSVIVGNSIGSTTSAGAVLFAVPVSVSGLAMSTLWSFEDGSGVTPYSPLTQGTDGNLYGTTVQGGTEGDGTVFKVTTNGAFTTLASFNVNNGAIPYAGLFLGKDGYLYGAADLGGFYGDGTLFSVTTAGTITVLKSLNGNNGMFPVAGMVQGSDGNFYGTAQEGGAYGFGTIFRMTTSGAVTTLVSFDDNDGAYPSPVLAIGSDGNLYGTTENGGTYGSGTVFKMSLSGLFTNLYSFTGGNDGGSPVPGVVQAADGNFYGTTYEDGVDGFGTVFEISSSGTLTTRYAFTGGTDGGNPWGALLQASDGNLYGTTQFGGTYGFGTVFQIAPTGLLTTMAQFDGYSGANPSAALIQAKDGSLYGTTVGGGLGIEGAIYRLSISGPLRITGQPADQAVFTGATALFTVATFGAAPVSYQWQEYGINLTNGGNISGANAATLRISNVTDTDAAAYSVVVSNAVNSVTSDEAVLELIFSPPGITTQPVSQTVVAGTTASFTVVAFGDQPLSYQWQENGTNLTDGGAISGSATTSLTISTVTSANAGTYSVIVSNAIRMASSANAVLTVVPATPPGASMSSVHLFSGGSDGAFPYAGLTEGRDDNLYGTAEGGGSQFDGVIFRMTLGGSVTGIYNFINSPTGAYPYGGLALGTDGDFYGTTLEGGTDTDGTIFRVTPSSGTVKYLYSFEDGDDGALPVAGLTLGSDGKFYGTALEGGTNGYGSVFKMTAAGAFTTLYGFTGGNDGAFPYAGVIQGRDGNFYGTALESGLGFYGTVFSLTPNGILTVLASFDATNGAFPQGGVIQGADGNLYGTTVEGGANGYGTIFSLTTNGILTTLFSFSLTNGSYPEASLVQGTDGNFYGTTSSGGAGGQGTVFRITTNGTLTTLLWFDGLNGADPEAPLVQASDGNFYGTTAQGGTGFNPSAAGGNGLIFRLTVPIFISNSITVTSAIAALPYSSSFSISNFAIAPQGDALSFAKVSGPLWLNVATNGLLSGTPANSDIGTNIFMVGLTDTNGVFASANLIISVIPDPPPAFILNPFAEPWANVDEYYSATIATNVSDAELGLGDILTFAKLSGPAWLSVTANGTLSGAPEDINTGTNTFVVSVTNLGGGSNTATMFVYVSSPPEWTLRNFSTPAATVGLPYSVAIATNVTDPNLGVGDTLTFYKVSGPAWLNVATNGGISGVPSSTNLGANTFLVLVVDSSGLSSVTDLSILVNAEIPPTFLRNPFTEAPAIVGQPYAAGMATNASAPPFGDVLTFTELSGPSWLSVAGNGSLSGTPPSTTIGNNVFIVSVADLEGLSNSATMYILVSVPGFVLQLVPQGPNLMLTWSGGIGPYQVELATNLNNPVWQNVGAPSSATNILLSPSNVCSFYRVQGQ
jgi:uncharacterized repeat protein (TIGR03803 family)